MSTHWIRCVVCGDQTACTEPSHALSAGQCCCDQAERGVWEPGMVAFCSAECFVSLERGMAERRRIVIEFGLDIKDELLSVGRAAAGVEEEEE